MPPGVHEAMTSTLAVLAAATDGRLTPRGRSALVDHARTLMPDADEATWEALVDSCLRPQLRSR